MHPTAAKVQARLHERGLDVEVHELPDSTRTARDAAAACGCELGQIVKSLVFVVDGSAAMVLCAGDRRGDTAALGVGARPASADEAREATGFAIGGVPTLADASLRRFDRVWCAAGTPNAVFEVELELLLAALPAVQVRELGV